MRQSQFLAVLAAITGVDRVLQVQRQVAPSISVPKLVSARPMLLYARLVFLCALVGFVLELGVLFYFWPAVVLRSQLFVFLQPLVVAFRPVCISFGWIVLLWKG